MDEGKFIPNQRRAFIELPIASICRAAPEKRVFQQTRLFSLTIASYHFAEMDTQLLFDLTADAKGVSVRFCENADIDSIRSTLAEKGVSVLEIDGAMIDNIDDLFRAFAIAFRKPDGWYGEEKSAPNADAFLEYLDDVVEWIPAFGYVAEFKNAESFWKRQLRLAGFLVELWQFATNLRNAKPHLLFVW